MPLGKKSSCPTLIVKGASPFLNCTGRSWTKNSVTWPIELCFRPTITPSNSNRSSNLSSLFDSQGFRIVMRYILTTFPEIPGSDVPIWRSGIHGPGHIDTFANDPNQYAPYVSGPGISPLYFRHLNHESRIFDTVLPGNDSSVYPSSSDLHLNEKSLPIWFRKS